MHKLILDLGMTYAHYTRMSGNSILEILIYIINSCSHSEYSSAIWPEYGTIALIRTTNANRFPIKGILTNLVLSVLIIGNNKEPAK